MVDRRKRRRPLIGYLDFDCWQHNVTEESRRHVDEDRERVFWRQGCKDYTKVFAKEDGYDEVRDIVYGTNPQMSFVTPHDDEARERTLRMGLSRTRSVEPVDARLRQERVRCRIHANQGAGRIGTDFQ